MATLCNMWGQVASHTKYSTGQYWDMRRNTNMDCFVDNAVRVKFLTLVTVLQLKKEYLVFKIYILRYLSP